MTDFWDGFEKQALKKRHLDRLSSAADHNESNENKKALHITYRKLNGRTVKRKINPLRVSDTHVLGYDHKRDDVRSFILDRVSHVKSA